VIKVGLTAVRKEASCLFEKNVLRQLSNGFKEMMVMMKIIIIIRWCEEITVRNGLS
jgi:hypothetical protein